VSKVSTLDVLSQLLPDYSEHLYLEIIKHFSWTNLFIEVCQNNWKYRGTPF